ncbi:MAG: ComEC/Rec2 family competence protein, partial [Candidatus Aerophobetes bacterium]|nr:ComEC/Rec2 family competence protein [Candidatus Aerophobetes bacterium]
MDKPIVGITLLFIAGIISGKYLNLPPLPLYLAMVGLSGLALIFFITEKRKRVTLFLFLAIFLIGLWEFRYVYFPHSPSHIVNFTSSSHSVEIIGCVANRPQLRKGRINFILEAKRINISHKEEKAEGKVWVTSYFPLQTYDYGDMVRIKGKLRRPEASEEGFNWQKYLSYQGIWVEVNTGKVELIRRGGGNFLVSQAYRSKDWMVKVIEHTLPEPYSGALKGIMLGDKESLPSEVKDYFLRTGTGHILVVSGLHVGLILLILLIFFRTIGLSPRLASLAAIPLLGYYAVLTGLRAPVMRATLMAIVGLVCLLTGRETPLLVVLSLAGIIILIFNPLSLFTVSFQLSFVTVGGIIYLTPYLEEKLPHLPRWLNRSLAVSLAAQLSILPLMAFYFNRLPLIGLITNLLIAPLMTIILALGFLTLGVGIVTIEGAKIMANANWVALTALLNMVKFFSFPQSELLSSLSCPYIRPFSPWLIVGYYSILLSIPY